MALQLQLVLGERQRLAGRDAKLELDEVEAGDRFGDGMLDLQAGVELEEVEARGVVGVDDQLDGAGVRVAAAACELDGRGTHAGAQLGVDDRRRGLLDQLLVAALEAALALAEVQDGAVVVADDLDLHVASTLEVALGEHRVVAEGRLGLAPRGCERRGELGVVVDHAHALAAAAGCRLEQQRKLLGGGPRADLLVAEAGAVQAGNDRDAGGLGGCLGGDLVAEQCDRVRAWGR